jgi:hypothetical protein
MEYIIVRGCFTANFKQENFTTLVNDKIKEGWIPQGGVTAIPKEAWINYGQPELAQAMFRDPNDPTVTYTLLKN